ncbi:formate dehydrogenase subunit delta [Pseudothioclava arenosa]|uniref:Formate dehydrogenase n=1 Tax=Pseudothioclava arenosa TaxID=1795308 RepID=A0A2A4CPA3_9RHOB|nr:formate dehydrogenase subunit delta [Pseudothioclava arenosa]PCD76108.1 formate dehydrogenase [Pseudothioclava arenosa]
MRKEIKMANQIARFFESQPGDNAAAVAAHINDNWSPTMRAELLARTEDPELHDLVRAALPLLRGVVRA